MTELAAESPLELAGNLVNGLDRRRLRADRLAGDLHHSHGLALSRDLAGIISNTRVLACDLADARDLARIIYGDRDLANTLSNACAHALDLAEDLTDARARDRASRGLYAASLAPGVIADLEEARTYAAARDRAHISAKDLATELAVARNLARDLARDLTIAAKTEERDDRVRPTRPAVRVAWTAAVLLTRRDRIRYDLEFQCELAELAAAGACWRQQLRYAARLLARAPLLRAELAGGRRRQAAR
jgi:hypothetical protein